MLIRILTCSKVFLLALAALSLAAIPVAASKGGSKGSGHSSSSHHNGNSGYRNYNYNHYRGPIYYPNLYYDRNFDRPWFPSYDRYYYSAPIYLGQPNGYVQPIPQPDYRVLIDVQVPTENAKIWFDGDETRQTGTERTFRTPAIEPGRTFSYEIRAAWMENGQMVSRAQRVSVRAGERIKVIFTAGNEGEVPPTPTPIR